jgi:replication-associated recombination protein RarA
MPNREFVADMQRSLERKSLAAEPSKGMLFLPKETNLRMVQFETRVKGLFTADPAFGDTITALLDDIESGWSGRLKSMILGAPAGSGKSTIMKELEGELGDAIRVNVFNASSPGDKSIEKSIMIDWNDLDSFHKQLQSSPDLKGDKVIVVIDEALKSKMRRNLAKAGVPLLNSAHAYGIRYLFIDAGFGPQKQLPVNSEFTSRCIPFYLPSLDQRPMDIPLIVGGVMFRQLDKTHQTIRFEANVLRAFTNSTLSKPNPRLLCNWAEMACRNALSAYPGSGQLPLTITLEHLPKELKPGSQKEDGKGKEYEFHRAPSQ